MLRPTGQKRPAIGCIYGGPGVGKTTMAAAFPSPIFICVEDGLASLGDNQPAAFPDATTFDQILDQIKAVGNEEHQYKTLVIDSVTRAARMCETEVCAREGKPIGMCMGGYGAGRAHISEMLQNMAFLCKKLSDHRGMNVLYLAHSAVTSVSLPDADPFDQYTLRMFKNYTDSFISDVDFVGLLKLQSTVYGTESKKKVRSDGTRFLEVTCHPSTVSKNRYNITQDLPVVQGENPLASFIPSLQEN